MPLAGPGAASLPLELVERKGMGHPDTIYCFLLSRIGRPVTEPQVFDVAVRLADPCALTMLAPPIAEIARAELDRVRFLWREALDGRLQVW